jgi:uncharacterized protein (DUF1501 family)
MTLRNAGCWSRRWSWSWVEFGRTPRINKDTGRDHYPDAGSLLMAGAGVRRGVVIGATDRIGSATATRPWTPEDVAASIYHAMGIDSHRTYFPGCRVRRRSRPGRSSMRLFA